MTWNILTLENYLMQLRQAVAICDSAGHFLFINSSFEETFGLASGTTKTFGMFFNSFPILLEAFSQVIAEDKSISVRDLNLKIHGGLTKTFHIEFFPVSGQGDADSVVAVHFHHIHGDFLFGEQRRRTAEVERLGLIASGLAHEIKNPLSAIRGAAQFIEKKLPDPSNLAKYTSIIIHESDRVDRLVRELMQLTRPRELKLVPLSLNDVVSGVINLLQPSIPTRIKIIESYDPSLPLVLGDLDALEQIFINIIKNAFEAIEGVGEIRVTSRFVTDMVFRQGEQKRMLVSMTIEDSGSGMTEEVLQKIFAPFYTTKAEGNGLGLSVVNRFVELHQGHLNVRSEWAKGSAFEFIFPA